MPLCIALAVREMGLTPAEAVRAATATAAAALDRDDVGVLAPGRRADLVVLDAPSLRPPRLPPRRTPRRRHLGRLADRSDEPSDLVRCGV